MAGELHPRVVVLAAGLVLSSGCESGARSPWHEPGDAAADGGEVSQPRDTGAPLALDAGAAGSPDAGWMPPAVTPPGPGSDREFWLSETGLYRDIADKALAPDLQAFEPAYALWSDGAEKQRWLRLPPGTRIDTSDMDHWQFPVGTMVWKEFKVDGKRIETRLIMRTGSAADAYFMGAFLWSDDESDARFARDGQTDARGTAHDVPAIKQCGTCHNGEPGRYLGYSAVQQPHAPADMLSAPPEHGYEVPGDDTGARSLGYLHANCGNCHNGHGSAWPDTDLVLRLYVGEHDPVQTALYRSTVGVATQKQGLMLPPKRIVRGDASASSVFVRMETREEKLQMPPFATKQVDGRVGVPEVRAFIEAL